MNWSYIEKTLKIPPKSDFSYVAGYKIDKQKLVAFPYSTNYQPKKEVKGSNPFTTTSRKINLE